MKTEVSEVVLYCHPGSRQRKGRRVVVRKKVLTYQRVMARTFFVILPEACPAGLTVTCNCCEYSQDLVQAPERLRENGDNRGFVRCSYSAEHEPAASGRSTRPSLSG